MKFLKRNNQNELLENSIKIVKPEDYREQIDHSLEFTSIAFTRLFAAILFLGAAILSLLVFGPEVGHHNTRYGNAIFLGGPSFFYVTGLPVLLIGIGLFIYFLYSLLKGKFSSSQNFLYFQEIRPRLPKFTEIPKEHIEGIRLQNNHLGPKLTWIIILTPFIVLQLMTAIPLFSSQRAAPEYALSWAFLVISLLEILAVFILVIYPQSYFEIASKEKIYEMWIAPRNEAKILLEFKKIFTLNSIPNKTNENERDWVEFDNIEKTHFNLFDLFLGSFLVSTTIIMLISMVLFASLFWWLGLIYGFILLIKAFFNDFSDTGKNLFYYNENGKVFKFTREFRQKFHYIIANKVTSVKVRKWYRKLDFFDVGLIGGMIVSLMFLQTEGWKIADSSIAIINNIISTFYMSMLFLLLILYTCSPIDVVEFKTPTINYRIPTTLKSENTSHFKRALNLLKDFKRLVWQEDYKKTFILRISIIGALIILGLILSFIEFQFYLF